MTKGFVVNGLPMIKYAFPLKTGSITADAVHFTEKANKKSCVPYEFLIKYAHKIASKRILYQEGAWTTTRYLTISCNAK